MLISLLSDQNKWLSKGNHHNPKGRGRLQWGVFLSTVP